MNSNHTQPNAAESRPPLDVYITVDTEFWPRRAYTTGDSYRADFRRDICGATRSGEFGLNHQIDVLNRHRLKAVFFVEPLCAFAVGDAPLREIVEMVQGGGQDVQLHMHSEWLDWMPEPILPEARGQNMNDFTLDQQTLLIEKGLAKLRSCGAEDVCAFRAGNYGANHDTLRALARNGVAYDTSHNTAYMGISCQMQTDETILHPVLLHDVAEFPITYVRDARGRDRVFQLTACSIGEMKQALCDAWRRGWSSVVIVSHSFELIQGRGSLADRTRPDSFVLRRFHWLCEFLSENRDKFRTATFSEHPQLTDVADPLEEPLRTRPSDTLARLGEQLSRRVIEFGWRPIDRFSYSATQLNSSRK